MFPLPAVYQDIPMIELRWLLHYSRFVICVLKCDEVGKWSQVLSPNLSYSNVCSSSSDKIRYANKKKMFTPIFKRKKNNLASKLFGEVIVVFTEIILSFMLDKVFEGSYTYFYSILRRIL